MVFDALQFGRAKGQDLWAALSDVRAAFPSVPAWEWRKAYRRVRLLGWVQGCYNFNESRCKARVSTAHGHTQYYDVHEVGATQGEADSPTKFLCHIDALLRYLTTKGRAYGVAVDLPDGWLDITVDPAELTAVLVADGVVVAAAFVDDLILLSDLRDGLQALLALVQDFYGFIGGEVVPHKSYWFTTASDVTLGELDVSLSVLATHSDPEAAGPRSSRRDAVVESVRSWCSDLGLESLEYCGSADVPASAGTTTRVTLRFPSPAYTLRCKSYTQFVRSLLSRPLALDGAQLQFCLGTAPPHLPCYRREAPEHMLG